MKGCPLPGAAVRFFKPNGQRTLGVISSIGVDPNEFGTFLATVVEFGTKQVYSVAVVYLEPASFEPGEDDGVSRMTSGELVTYCKEAGFLKEQA